MFGVSSTGGLPAGLSGMAEMGVRGGSGVVPVAPSTAAASAASAMRCIKGSADDDDDDAGDMAPAVTLDGRCRVSYDEMSETDYCRGALPPGKKAKRAATKATQGGSVLSGK